MKKVSILLLLFIVSSLFSGCTDKKTQAPVLSSNQNQEVLEESGQTGQTGQTELEREEKEDPQASNAPQFISQCYIFPNSSKQLLTQADLFLLDSFTLKLAKNEIFARKGYIFKNEALKNYFSHMPWYQPDEAAKGTFEELNDIEKQNVKLIENYSVKEPNTKYGGNMKYEEGEINKSMSIEENPYGLSYQEVSSNGRLYNRESVRIDLNEDGLLEELTVYFYPDTADDWYPSIIEIKDSNGRQYTQTYEAMYVHPFINIADFDIQDGLIQFYISQSGPSYDPCVQIFSFDGEKIIQDTNVAGFITRYDGRGKIYSFDEYSINCYYDLKDGVTILPKENMVQSKIKADYNLQLFDAPFTEPTYAVVSSLLDENNQYNGPCIENYVGIVPKGTQMEILDIEFEKNENGGYSCVPWLKVKTSTGMVGWYCLSYGD